MMNLEKFPYGGSERIELGGEAVGSQSIVYNKGVKGHMSGSRMKQREQRRIGCWHKETECRLVHQ